ncbi:MAG: hypothetical protein AB1390_02860 [Nitrospirota bacterium]
MIDNWKHLFLKSPFIPLFQRGSDGISCSLVSQGAHVDSRKAGIQPFDKRSTELTPKAQGDIVMVSLSNHGFRIIRQGGAE